MAAWKGLGSATAALWRSRHLPNSISWRILVVLTFLGALSVLQIVVPSAVTVGTAVSTSQITLNATLMPIDYGKPSDVFNFEALNDDSSSSTIAFATMPYVWAQDSDVPTGAPSGANGT